MTIMAKFAPLKEAYDALRAQGVDPFSVKFDDILSPTEGVLNGRTTILLGTNNYLGLTFDESCIEASVEVLRSQGTGTTGSRIANGSYSGHRDLEDDLAKFYGREHCMVFSTGYQANLGLLSTVAGRGDHLVIDADSHASIYDGCRLGHAEVVRFRHNDPDDLFKRLRRLKDQPGDKIIVTEGLYSMLGDKAPLKEIAQVKRETGAYLIVDEAHSMGVLGETGRGLADLWNPQGVDEAFKADRPAPIDGRQQIVDGLVAPSLAAFQLRLLDLEEVRRAANDVIGKKGFDIFFAQAFDVERFARDKMPQAFHRLGRAHETSGATAHHFVVLAHG